MTPAPPPPNPYPCRYCGGLRRPTYHYCEVAGWLRGEERLTPPGERPEAEAAAALQAQLL